MRSTRFASLAALTLFGYLSGPASGAALFVCVQDGWNLAMSSFSAEASPYCSDLLNIPAATETVATTTPVVTSIPTSTTFFAVTVRASGTTTLTQTVTSVVTATAAPSRLAKRGLRPKDAVWVERARSAAAVNAVALRRRQTNSTEAAQDQADSLSSLSSACTCLRVATTTISVTATASPSTRIINAIDQIDTTTTLQSQVTVLTTVVVTTTTTPTGLSSSLSVTAGGSSSVSTTFSAAPTGVSTDLPTSINGTISAAPTSVSTDLPTDLEGPSMVLSFTLNGTRARPSYATSGPSRDLTLSLSSPTQPTQTPVVGLPAPTITSTVTSVALNTTSVSASTSSSACAFPSPIGNGGFERLLDDGSLPPWQVETNSDTVRFGVVPGTFDSPAFSGGRHGQVVSNAPNDRVLLTQTLTVCPNTIYDFSGWCRIPLEQSGCKVEVRMDGYPVAFTIDDNLQQAYGEISGSFGPVPVSTLGLQVLISCDGPGNGIVDLDTFSLTIRR